MNRKNRINGFHKYALLGSCAFMDALQIILSFIPFIGPFIASAVSLMGRASLWIWFKMLDVGFADKSNRYFVNISMTIAEVLPLVNFFPWWTIGTWTIIRQVRHEDQEFNKKLEMETVS